MRSQVHRFRVAFISPALLISQQVLDETTNGSAGASGMIIPKMIGSRFRVQGSKVIVH